jgi:two-component system, chemotaxis family, protein-glutamate methylesterase/glutaminase
MAARPIEAIVIGGSAGALEALGAILPALSPDVAIPIVIVLHVPPAKTSYLPEVLGARCALPVKEAEDKEPLAAGTVYVAPNNYHLLIEKKRYFSLSVDDPVHYSRPSIDVLFESAADAYGPALAGVLLTGASEDGARGLARIKAAGGETLVQSPLTALARTMPEAALRLAPADHVLPLGEIGSILSRLGARRLLRLEAG